MLGNHTCFSSNGFYPVPGRLQMNNFKQVSSNHHQMSLAGVRPGLGPGGPGLMSRSAKGDPRSDVQCGQG